MIPSDWGWLSAQHRAHYERGYRKLPFLWGWMPWLMLAFLLLMFCYIENRLTLSEGIVLELPKASQTDAVVPTLTAVMLPVIQDGLQTNETLIYFDDARYSLNDEQSLNTLRESLGERSANDKTGMLLVLADVHVSTGDLMRFMSVAREAGVVRLQVAERRE